MKITLLRHTEVDEAYHGCYNGHIDIGLSQVGYEQAQELAKYFNQHTFDGVFCSDLKRAKDTLCHFSQAKDAIYTKKLREKSWGKHEGLTFDEIIAQNEIRYNDFLQWINALDGESYELYIQRVKEFFLEFLPSTNKEKVLVVTHAGVIRVLISIVKKISLQEAFSINIGYAAYIVYDSNKNCFSDVKLIQSC